jgi:DNA repair protein RecO (recombination protein O)
MGLHKDEAIILIKRAYGESDRILHLFTRQSGKVAAIAKGGSKSQKRFANTLEPFNRVTVEYFEKDGKGMVRIENADLLETNSGLEKSLRRACTAAFFTEFVNRLTKERERHEELFEVLKVVLCALKSADFSYDDILRYELRMLEVLGFMPNFDACVYCSGAVAEDEKVLFSKERGGILCHRCARSLPYRAYTTGVIPRIASFRNLGRAFDNGDREDAFSVPPGGTAGNGRFIGEAQDIMEGFTSFHLDVDFRSYRILKSLFQGK